MNANAWLQLAIECKHYGEKFEENVSQKDNAYSDSSFM